MLTAGHCCPTANTRPAHREPSRTSDLAAESLTRQHTNRSGKPSPCTKQHPARAFHHFTSRLAAHRIFTMHCSGHFLLRETICG